MLTVVTAAEMRELDRRATAEFGIPSIVLMENAGAETVRALRRAYPDALSGGVAIVCGRGNNGGDGFVIARRLLGAGVAVRTFLVGEGEVRGDARTNLEILQRLGAPPLAVTGDAGVATLREALPAAALTVDALLGTGTRGPAAGLAAAGIAAMNAAGRPVVAVDVPSGVQADTPRLDGPAVHASLTVTFALPKPALLLYPAARCAGRVEVADIGLPAALTAGPPALGLLEAADARAALPPRDPAGHKGAYGHVLVIAGSPGKTGAAAMAAEAALRAGAGLVTLAVPDAVQHILAVKLTEVMTEGVPAVDGGAMAWDAHDRLLELAAGKSAVALGPGLGTHPSTVTLVRELLRRLALPVVVDADALNALAGQPELVCEARSPRVLTPHPGELARLLGVDRDRAVEERLHLVPETARRLGATLVLKTARTLVAGPDGGAAIVPTGNPGMATAGSGDVLTGMIAGLLGQGVPPTRAAQAGAYLHGLAGDLAAAALGPEAMLAGDLLRFLPAAIRRVHSGNRAPSAAGRGAKHP